MKKKVTKPKGMLKQTKEHYKKVYDVLKKVLDCETSDNVLGDIQLAKVVKSMGVYCSHAILRDVRLYYKVPTAYQRKMRLFEQEYAEKRGKKRGK